MSKAIHSIDVIIPAYNAANFIIETLENVLAQSYPINKIIIVDDGSKDDTIKIVENFSNDKIVLLKHEKNKGVSAARNTGIAASNADMIAFLDADDLWTPDKLEKQIALFDASDNKLGVVYSNYMHIDQDGNPIEGHINPPLLKGDIFKDLLYNNYVSGSASAVLIKKRFIDKVGLFRTDLYYGEDWDYWLRLAALCQYDFTEEPLVKIRIHATNAQHGMKNSKVKQLRLLRQEVSVLATWKSSKVIPYELYFKYFMRFYNLPWKHTPNGRLSFARKAMNVYFPHTKWLFIIISLDVIFKKLSGKI